jgi:hypothetical protein
MTESPCNADIAHSVEITRVLCFDDIRSRPFADRFKRIKPCIGMQTAHHHELSICEMNITTTSALDGTERRSPGRLVHLATVIVLALMLAGCGKGGDAATTNDPEVDARLIQLTRELHHTMVGRKLNRDFDEFVALSKLEVPPPPPGKKYAISEKWKVILVNK